MKSITRSLAVAALLCLATVRSHAQTVALPSPLVPQAANMVPICSAACNVTAVTDAAGQPVAGAKFQAGSRTLNAWGALFTPGSLPLFVSYSNQVNLGWPEFVAGYVPDEIDAQQTAIAYTVAFSNTGTPPVTGSVVVPALAPAPAPVPAPIPTPAPAGSASCPAGTYEGIATGLAGETAQIAAGMVYRVEPSTTCITASAQTTVDVSSGNLDVLETAATQLVPVTRAGGQTNNVVITSATPATDPQPVISVQSVSITVNGNLLVCRPASGAVVGTYTCGK